MEYSIVAVRAMLDMLYQSDAWGTPALTEARQDLIAAIKTLPPVTRHAVCWHAQGYSIREVGGGLRRRFGVRVNVTELLGLGETLLWAVLNGVKAEESMTPNEYQDRARETRGHMSKKKLLLNAALGLAGEAGEVADHIKKVEFQGHEMNRAHLIEEAGDVLWYVAELCDGLGVSLEEVMEGNIAKLAKRYPNGFSVERSVNREGDAA